MANEPENYNDNNRTRGWVYKRLERSQSGKSDWCLDKLRALRNKPGKISQELEQAIAKSRIKLAKRDLPETKYVFCGAVAIHQELDNFGYRIKPALTTINRVLKRNELIATQKKDVKEKSSKKFFPHIKAQRSGHLHQLDLVTPRYVKGFGVITSVNRIDERNCSKPNLMNLGGLLKIKFLQKSFVQCRRCCEIARATKKCRLCYEICQLGFTLNIYRKKRFRRPSTCFKILINPLVCFFGLIG